MFFFFFFGGGAVVFVNFLTSVGTREREKIKERGGQDEKDEQVFSWIVLFLSLLCFLLVKLISS